ncbi:MAG: acyl-CoA carboxylase subunit epsilon [Actinomycetales bacterium]
MSPTQPAHPGGPANVGGPDEPGHIAPTLRIDGNPTAEQIAAVTAVLIAAARGPVEADQAPKAPSRWSTPPTRPTSWRPGPGAWMSSGWGR